MRDAITKNTQTTNHLKHPYTKVIPSRTRARNTRARYARARTHSLRSRRQTLARYARSRCTTQALAIDRPPEPTHTTPSLATLARCALAPLACIVARRALAYASTVPRSPLRASCSVSPAGDIHISLRSMWMAPASYTTQPALRSNRLQAS